MDIVSFLINLAPRFSLSLGWNDIGNHYVPENGGYHAEIKVKANEYGEITDFGIYPLSDNPQGAHDHIYNVHTRYPERVQRSKYDW